MPTKRSVAAMASTHPFKQAKVEPEAELQKRPSLGCQLHRLDTGYGRSKKAKAISAENPARCFPASDEQIGGPFSAGKHQTWLPPYIR